MNLIPRLDFVSCRKSIGQKDEILTGLKKLLLYHEFDNDLLEKVRDTIQKCKEPTSQRQTYT